MTKDRKKLIDRMIKSGVLKSKEVIRAFESVPRENFVLKEYKKLAYIDEPLPILANQTISQPTTVAIMTEALELKPSQKVLEVGTGSGYQAAILSKIVGETGKIYTIERIKELYGFAAERLNRYKNVNVILGDGSKGYEASAPYDRIIVTAGSPKVPDILFEQLKEGGIIIIPVGKTSLSQKMLKIEKVKGKKVTKDLGFFVFVPLIGEFGHKKEQ